MLNLNGQPTTSISPSSKHALDNVSSKTRNTFTTTTTLATLTPSSAVFPALRTPKEIVLQDIAVQCISPALPSFDSSVMDVMARSKTIQEEQRRIIAQRRRDEGLLSDEEDYLSHLRQGHMSNQPSPEPSHSPCASCEMNNNEPAKQNPKHSESGVPVQTDLIVAESGNFIIEAVPTPTEARINTDAITKPASMTRKTRPGSIKIFPFDASRKDPPIKSAPLHYASPYSPHGYPSRRVPAAVTGTSAVPTSLISPLNPRFGGVVSYQQQQRQQPYQHQQQFRSGQQQKAAFFPRHPGAHQLNVPPLSAVPTSYNNPILYMNQSLRNSDNFTSFIGNKGPTHKHTTAAPTALHEEEEDDDENDKHDPEDAALSDSDEGAATSKYKIHVPSSNSAPGMAKGTAIKVHYDDDDEEDDDANDLSDVEAKAIAEDDERASSAPAAAAAIAAVTAVAAASRKRRRENDIEMNGHTEADQNARRKRFIAICGELWDLMKSSD
ncbi:hypothetical protein D0Z00_001868 [Geotrichum galactomycetum]|uniref:Uncharacterized protein n=1 Tax=Geotrichum galactomycetum TaxID=27317 RepID=A0ACB6V5Q1_9ASCO|nr:hypothetical protein D0Z00_001868 [Geotrichum candidum]